MITNETPYIGKIKLKFEKFPHYRGSNSGILNKIHLDLGFTKLVSRMYPLQVIDGHSNIDPDKSLLIRKYTGGKISTHTWGDDNDFTLENSFMSLDDQYIGDIERGWWYYKNNMVVCESYPHGVSIKLKEDNYFRKNKEYYHSFDLFSEDIEGYYGYTHRGGQLFKIGDRLFDGDYIPVRSDYTQKEWDGWYSKLQKRLKTADELDKKWLTEDGIAGFIPFNKRGAKIIQNWDEAKEAAINVSKYLG